MVQTCSRCSRPNPDDAVYCHHDGGLLAGHADGGRLDPGKAPFPQPFEIPGAGPCQNFDQLALACLRNWDAAKTLLRKGRLEQFLGGIGRIDLALAARAAAEFPDGDRGLDQLLGKLPTDTLPPARLTVSPGSLRPGAVSLSSPKPWQVRIGNEGGRLLYGAVVSDSPWLAVGPGPGQAQFLFQCQEETTVAVQPVPGQLRARPEPYTGALIVESNGGRASVPVRLDVPVQPFPEGALAGARTPREIAVKAKEAPKEAAALFEKGAVARWYAANGWAYPVRGEAASGVAAVQQFFEALGLVKPPAVEVGTAAVQVTGRPGETVESTFKVFTREKRHLYAHAAGDRAWVEVTTTPEGNTSAVVRVRLRIPSGAAGTLQASVKVDANGNQQFTVPVRVAVRGSAVAPARAAAPPPLPGATAVDEEPILATAVGPAPPRPDRASGVTRRPAAGRGSAPLVELPARRGRGRGGARHSLPALCLALVLLALVAKDALFSQPPEAGGETRVRIETPGTRIGGAAGPGVPVDPRAHVEYHYGPNRRFGVFVVDTGKLLTYSPVGETNTTVVRVDGRDAEFGSQFQGQWVSRDPEPDFAAGPADARSRSTWLEPTGRVRVTQALDLFAAGQPVEVAPGEYRLQRNACLIAYQLENTDSVPHAVGLRLQLDTLIGANDGVPFTMPGRDGLVDSFADYPRPEGVPDFIQALERPDLADPGTVAHLTLKLSGLEPPGRVSLTRWPGPNALLWDVPVRHIEDRGSPIPQDSSVVLYWPEARLMPGETRSVGFAYGLGSVTASDASGTQIGLTLSGSFDPGSAFVVTAYVKNARPRETLRLGLPDDGGLTLAGGESTQTVPPPTRAGQASLVTWRVRVEKAGRHPLEVRSGSGTVERRMVTITQDDPAKRATSPDNIFR